MYDIVIIGAGMAGMTAALYAQRNEKKVLIIESDTIGGQIANSPKVENYPTIPSISGSDLANKVFEQVMERGADFELERVEAVAKREDGVFEIKTDYGVHEGRSVIVAAGVKHRHLGLEKEEELVGKGVSYCAVCDGPFYKGEDVVLVGSGNAALQYAILLSQYCRNVYQMIITPDFTGDEILVNTVKRTPNIHYQFNTAVTEILGKDEVEGVHIKAPDGERDVACKGLFVAIGQIPDNKPYEELADLDRYGYLAADESCTTRTEGLFVAGDCRTKQIRQLTTASADGAIAALAACTYLM